MGSCCPKKKKKNNKNQNDDNDDDTGLVAITDTINEALQPKKKSTRKRTEEQKKTSAQTCNKQKFTPKKTKSTTNNETIQNKGVYPDSSSVVKKCPEDIKEDSKSSSCTTESETKSDPKSSLPPTPLNPKLEKQLCPSELIKGENMTNVILDVTSSSTRLPPPPPSSRKFAKAPLLSPPPSFTIKSENKTIPAHSQTYQSGTQTTFHAPSILPLPLVEHKNNNDFLQAPVLPPPAASAPTDNAPSSAIPQRQDTQSSSFTITKALSPWPLPPPQNSSIVHVPVPPNFEIKKELVPISMTNGTKANEFKEKSKSKSDESGSISVGSLSSEGSEEENIRKQTTVKKPLTDDKKATIITIGLKRHKKKFNQDKTTTKDTTKLIAAKPESKVYDSSKENNGSKTTAEAHISSDDGAQEKSANLKSTKSDEQEKSDSLKLTPKSSTNDISPIEKSLSLEVKIRSAEYEESGKSKDQSLKSANNPAKQSTEGSAITVTKDNAHKSTDSQKNAEQNEANKTNGKKDREEK